MLIKIPFLAVKFVLKYEHVFIDGHNFFLKNTQGVGKLLKLVFQKEQWINV